jgi:hypothetical protein
VRAGNRGGCDGQISDFGKALALYGSGALKIPLDVKAFLRVTGIERGRRVGIVLAVEAGVVPRPLLRGSEAEEEAKE